MHLYQHPQNRNPLMPPGPATADEIWMPLDRQTLLVLHRNAAVGEVVMEAPPEQTIDECNQIIVQHAKAEVYLHPEDIGRLDELRLPDPDHPVLQIDGAWGPLPDGVNQPPERRRPRRYNQARNAPR